MNTEEREAIRKEQEAAGHVPDFNVGRGPSCSCGKKYVYVQGLAIHMRKLGVRF